VLTTKDFERIAAILSAEESVIEAGYDLHGSKSKRAIELSVLESVISRLVLDFAKSNPRFNESKFRAYARPIQAHQHKARVKQALAAQEWRPDTSELERHSQYER
jgi:hypothetical protein